MGVGRIKAIGLNCSLYSFPVRHTFVEVRLWQRSGSIHCAFLFRGLDSLSGKNRAAVPVSLPLDGVILSLQDLIHYFRPPEEELEHEEKQTKLRSLRNRQNLFQEEVCVCLCICVCVLQKNILYSVKLVQILYVFLYWLYCTEGTFVIQFANKKHSLNLVE